MVERYLRLYFGELWQKPGRHCRIIIGIGALTQDINLDFGQVDTCGTDMAQENIHVNKRVIYAAFQDEFLKYGVARETLYHLFHLTVSARVGGCGRVRSDCKILGSTIYHGIYIADWSLELQMIGTYRYQLHGRKRVQRTHG